MTAIDWPSELKPSAFGYFPIDADQSGGAAMNGSEQFVISPGPRWGASMTVHIKSKAELLAARRLRVSLHGRANPAILPNFDGKRLSWPEELHQGDPTGVILHPGVTRDKTLDGTDFEDPEIPDESEIQASVHANVALRATSMQIRVAQGGAILPGQQFGIGQRLYEIATVIDSLPVEISGEGIESVYNVTFTPPLRAAASEGEEVLFTRPVCLMRCLNLNDELRKLEGLRFATLNLEFAEYF